jgi:hypothetical protein
MKVRQILGNFSFRFGNRIAITQACSLMDKVRSFYLHDAGSIPAKSAN